MRRVFPFLALALATLLVTAVARPVALAQSSLDVITWGSVPSVSGEWVPTKTLHPGDLWRAVYELKVCRWWFEDPSKVRERVMQHLEKVLGQFKLKHPYIWVYGAKYVLVKKDWEACVGFGRCMQECYFYKAVLYGRVMKSVEVRESGRVVHLLAPAIIAAVIIAIAIAAAVWGMVHLVQNPSVQKLVAAVASGVHYASFTLPLLVAGVGVLVIAIAIAIAVATLRGKKSAATVIVLAVLAASTLLAVPAHAQSAQGIDREAMHLAYSLGLDKSVVIVLLSTQYGTGWWVSKHWIITAAHVVDWKAGITVRLLHGSWSATGIVKYVDKQHDVAAIYVPSGAPSWVKTLPLCSSVHKGEQIIVLGYPFELIQLVPSLQQASANPRASFGWVDWVDTQRKIFEIGARTDAGNSGGPVLDYSKLCVVGIVSFALRGEVANMYYGTSTTAIQLDLDRWNVPHRVVAIHESQSLSPAPMKPPRHERIPLSIIAAGLGGLCLGLIAALAAVSARGGRR